MLNGSATDKKNMRDVIKIFSFILFIRSLVFPFFFNVSFECDLEHFFFSNTYNRRNSRMSMT